MFEQPAIKLKLFIRRNLDCKEAECVLKVLKWSATLCCCSHWVTLKGLLRRPSI